MWVFLFIICRFDWIGLILCLEVGVCEGLGFEDLCWE